MGACIARKVVLKYFSMFSGIGGFEYGIQRASQIRRAMGGETSRFDMGYKRNMPNAKDSIRRTFSSVDCIGYSEIDKYSIQIYEKHFKGHKNYGDATRIVPEEIEDFDLLCGGFPCQSFSIAGKRGGFKDTRGTMFFEIARILSVKRPKLLLLENVKGLLSHDNGRTFGTILATLSELGYICQWQVLNSKNFGVPQNRERVFIVGHLRGTSRPEVFPIGENGGEAVFGAIKNTYYKGQTTGSYIESEAKIRRLTPVECERLQGFPDGWTEGISDTQRYKCLGNAVTVNVIEAIMKKLT